MQLDLPLQQSLWVPVSQPLTLEERICASGMLPAPTYFADGTHA
ncbi:MAG: hypothetical protein R2818_05770 [Flavobacteriales bacterium]